MAELVRILIDVLVPVVAVAAVGWFAARRWKLDYRPKSTIAYNFLAPAFIFRLLTAPTGLDGPIATMAAASVATVVIVFGLAWLLFAGRRGERRVLDSMSSMFGNVGNLGFPIILFALGDGALPEAGVHFIAVIVSAFFLGIVAAARLRSGGVFGAIRRVVTTPVLFVIAPAIYINTSDIVVATSIERGVGLLADAMIPVMLLTLGMQLATTRVTRDVVRIGMVALVKLLVAPLVFFAVATALDLSGDARDTGLLMAAMPTAVFVVLISLEYDLESEVASATILVTSLLSLVTVGAILRFL